MSDKYDDILKYMGRAFYIIVAGLLFLLIVSMCSCTRTVYVPQTTIQRDSVYLTQYQRDSIWMHDSVWVKEKGDTIWLEKWHTKFVERLVTDTTYIERADTIREPYPVEKQLSWSQKTYITLGRTALGAIILSIILLIVHIALKRRI